MIFDRKFIARCARNFCDALDKNNIRSYTAARRLAETCLTVNKHEYLEFWSCQNHMLTSISCLHAP